MARQQDRREQQRRDPNEAPTLFSALMANLGPGRTREARRHNLEIGLGFLAFFSLMSFVSLVIVEVRGGNAPAQAIITCVFLGLTWLVYRAWRRAGGWSTPGSPRR